ncbi:MAG: hypothetical protein C4520_15405 [Candidatus Abyssobacteria bacterium SURF_5]|uniref:Uncharacterized protein n=1 Tax=Abyssobacteria bacterium (strain SURF_5) TaxID=2093360 RepID=A0A3A4NGY8_ABYX5|nr:MAG: hypothetical protein C4520_15405 [Candidatus Abyssubacteria bacterium SURF_5]
MEQGVVKGPVLCTAAYLTPSLLFLLIPSGNICDLEKQVLLADDAHSPVAIRHQQSSNFQIEEPNSGLHEYMRLLKERPIVATLYLNPS